MKDKPAASLTGLPALARSPLMRAAFCGFLCLAVVEVIFVSALCSGVMKVETAAEHQYKTLRAAESISELADVLRQHRRAVDDGRFHPAMIGVIRIHRARTAAVKAFYAELCQEWKRAGLGPETPQVIGVITDKLLADGDQIFNPRNSAEMRESAFADYLNETSTLYADSLEAVRRLHAVIQQDEQLASKLPDQMPLVLTGATVFLAVALLIVYLLEACIAGPIGRLAKTCQGLAMGRIMPKPPNLRNEISRLEMVFHEMSKTAADNEKARASYLELLNDSQRSALFEAQSDVQALSDAADTTPEARTALQVVLRSIKGMLNLLQSLTEGLTARADEGVVVRPAPTNAGAIVSNVRAIVDSLANKRNIKMEYQLQDSPLIADQPLLERVLTNFISNAIKFSPTGTTVTVKSTVIGDMLKIDVIDQGPGITPEDQAKLFQKFSRLEPADQSKKPGTGLGLLICKQIVEAHAGQIGCASELGHGSTFWFTLPLNAQALPAPPSTMVAAGESPHSRSTSLAAKKPPRIIGSIKYAFILILVLFLACQSMNAFVLHQKFQEATSASTQYIKQRKLIVETQELLTLFLHWRLQAAKAASSRDMMAVLNTLPLLREQVKEAAQLVVDSRGEPIEEIAASVAGGIDALRRASRYYIEHAATISGPDMEVFIRRADQRSMDVENLLFSTLKMEGAELKSAYDLTGKIRTQIFYMMAANAALNLALLLALLLVCARLLDRISLLNDKARCFAAGEPLLAPLPGNDELTYLDRCLCDVAAGIRAAEQQRQTLMAVINHDLRTPLASSLAALEMISSGMFGELEQVQSDQVATTEKSFWRLLEQVNDLLMVERLESGVMQVGTRDNHLASVVENAVRKAGEYWSWRKIEFKLDIAEDARQVDVLGDTELLERSCRALLDNAAAASTNGGTVSVGLKPRDRKVDLTVHDNGGGIAPDLLKQLFERFRSIHGAAVTGMGLPLTYRISRLLGGDLTVEKTSPQGTSISMRLPISPNAEKIALPENEMSGLL